METGVEEPEKSNHEIFQSYKTDGITSPYQANHVSDFRERTSDDESCVSEIEEAPR